MTPAADAPALPRPTPAAPTAEVFSLPRPNLGPEPWAEPAPAWRSGAGLVAGMVILALILAARRHRARLARGRAAADLAGLDPWAGGDDTPARRLVASSRSVRAALIAAFGPAWGSRTTEEIAADPALAARVGPEVAATLVAYLRDVDRAKFAGEEPEEADAWVGSAREILAALARRPARPITAAATAPPAGGRRSS